MLEYSKEGMGKHLEFYPRKRLVKYRNVIAPKHGGRSFPNGYFDEKVKRIPYHTANEIGLILEKVFEKRLFVKNMPNLPDGASSDAYRV